MAPYVFFFPWTREAGEEEDFSSSVFHRHFSLKMTPTNPTCPKKTFHVLEGRQHNGRPSHVTPLFLPIKTGGKTNKKKGKRKKNKRGEERGEDQRAE